MPRVAMSEGDLAQTPSGVAGEGRASPAEGEIAVDCRKLVKRFAGGSVVALDGVSLTIRANEFFTLLGPSGCGKTTLLRLIAGFETQDEGSILVHEWMFENRLIFTDKLILMGADIVMCDPHRAIVTGPRKLRGERVESPDIRAGMAMLLAALCADGRSEIGNIRQIDRGYERIDERLRELGARIERVATEPAIHA